MANENQLSEWAYLEKKHQDRKKIIATKIEYTPEELDCMPVEERKNAILKIKQDETMYWQRKSAEMYYYLTIASLIAGALIGFIYILKP